MAGLSNRVTAEKLEPKLESGPPTIGSPDDDSRDEDRGDVLQHENHQPRTSEPSYPGDKYHATLLDKASELDQRISDFDVQIQDLHAHFALFRTREREQAARKERLTILESTISEKAASLAKRESELVERQKELVHRHEATTKRELSRVKQERDHARLKRYVAHLLNRASNQEAKLTERERSLSERETKRPEEEQVQSDMLASTTARLVQMLAEAERVIHAHDESLTQHEARIEASWCQLLEQWLALPDRKKYTARHFLTDIQRYAMSILTCTVLLILHPRTRRRLLARPRHEECILLSAFTNLPLVWLPALPLIQCLFGLLV